MSARVEAAIQSFYENPDLRDELTDDEAGHLLKWAEAELSKVDARHADDAEFEEAAGTLGSLIKSINRFIGRRGYATPDEQAAAFAKIAAHAQALGYPLPATFEPTFEAQAATDNVTALQTLLSQIEHSAEPEAESPAPAAPPQPVTAAPVESVESAQAASPSTTSSPAPQTPSDEPTPESIDTSIDTPLGAPTPEQHVPSWRWSYPAPPADSPISEVSFPAEPSPDSAPDASTAPAAEPDKTAAAGSAEFDDSSGSGGTPGSGGTSAAGSVDDSVESTFTDNPSGEPQ